MFALTQFDAFISFFSLSQYLVGMRRLIQYKCLMFIDIRMRAHMRFFKKLMCRRLNTEKNRTTLFIYLLISLCGCCKFEICFG